MRVLKGSLVSLLLLASVLVSHAQEFETGYFLGGNPFAYRLNPAFQSERNIISIGLGQTGVGAWSNLGVSSLLYPGNDGKLYTFMNDRVSAQEFLGKIHRHNSLDADIHLNVLSVGFWSHDSFMTIDINLRSLNAVSAPYDLFRFLKEGTQNTTSFDLSGTGVRSKTFGEIAFGWSNRFSHNLSFGFRAKALVGILEAEMLMKNLRMTLNDDRWEVASQGEMNLSSPSLSIRKNADGELEPDSIGFLEGFKGPAGYGAAVDLGASWNVLPLLTLSASLLDLGTIRWNREIRGTTPDASYAWDPSDKAAIDPVSGEENAFEREFEDAADALSGLFRFKEAGGGKPAFDLLPFRFNLGAEFRMPFYERLSVGALYTARGAAAYGRHTGRFSVNWSPLDFLSLSTGTTLNKLGESFGFALNLHPNGVNLMVGGDYIPFSCVNIAPLIDGLPARYRNFAVIPAHRMNLNLYVGLNVAFGRRHL